MRRRRLGIAALAGVLAGCDGTPLGAGPLPRLRPLATDPRVSFEASGPDPTAQTLASLAGAALPRALDQVEMFCGGGFPRPPEVRVFATVDSFERFSGLRRGSQAQAATLDAVVNLSPALLAQPGLVAGILTHELTHAWLDQRLSTFAARRLPPWFQEGLAVAVANGAGAEGVSEAEARAALRAGQRFVPEPASPVLGGRHLATAYGLSHHMFYRQSAMFLGWLKARNTTGFAAMLRAVAAGEGLEAAFRGGLGLGVEAAWAGFLAAQAV